MQPEIVHFCHLLQRLKSPEQYSQISFGFRYPKRCEPTIRPSPADHWQLFWMPSMHLERRLLLKLHNRLAQWFIIQLYGLTFRFVVLIFNIANGVFFCIIVIIIIIKVVFLRRATSATGYLGNSRLFTSSSAMSCWSDIFWLALSWQYLQESTNIHHKFVVGHRG